MNSCKHKINGKEFTWEPGKSTPSSLNPVTELTNIISYLKDLKLKSIIDFGCGNGRNSTLLNKAFSRVLLVECPKNVDRLKKDETFKSFQIIDYDSFKKLKTQKFDSVLLSFILHTLPNKEILKDILETLKSKCNNGSTIVVISPKNDSKYTIPKTTAYEQGNHGIYKTFPDGFFSFYRNLTQAEIIEMMKKFEFSYTHKIVSKSRNILFFKID
jgi:2-polyprenyl-3-methyl-5-hydroxy-6-metoxy-1,4-benzoquinol methylase